MRGEEGEEGGEGAGRGMWGMGAGESGSQVRGMLRWARDWDRVMGWARD